jgi:hypothetical protein
VNSPISPVIGYHPHEFTEVTPNGTGDRTKRTLSVQGLGEPWTPRSLCPASNQTLDDHRRRETDPSRCSFSRRPPRAFPAAGPAARRPYPCRVAPFSSELPATGHRVRILERGGVDASSWWAARCVQGYRGMDGRDFAAPRGALVRMRVAVRLSGGEAPASGKTLKLGGPVRKYL